MTFMVRIELQEVMGKAGSSCRWHQSLFQKILSSLSPLTYLLACLKELSAVQVQSVWFGSWIPGAQELWLCRSEHFEPGAPVPRDCKGWFGVGTQLCTSVFCCCHQPPRGVCGAQPHGTNSPLENSGAVKLQSELDCFCGRAAVWVCAGCHSVLPHTEHFSPAPLEPPHHCFNVFKTSWLLTMHFALVTVVPF